MGRSRVLLTISLATCGIAVACNALTGVGDLGVTPPNDAQTSDDGRDEVGPALDATRRDVEVDAADGGRPSFCEGLVLYAPFDGTYATAQGGAPDPEPANPFVPGKYDKAVVSAGTSGSIFYPEGEAGVIYPKDAGTMAVWFKPTWSWPSTVDRVFVKPAADRSTGLNGSGPQFRYEVDGTIFGFIDQNADNTLTSAAVTAAEVIPYWNDLSWNHLVGTWNKLTPSLTFTLNGASGDPSVTHRTTNAPWTPQFPDVRFMRLGSNVNVADGSFDEFAIWNRELSLLEIKAVYGANRSIGDACAGD
jgi:hypothetical protein